MHRQARWRARAAAASRLWRGAAITRASARAKQASPGLGVSQAPLRRASRATAGSAMAWRSSRARASAQVPGSGTVGPLAMTEGSSPGTSEISRLSTRAGAQAAASRPPLMAERCLRTVFIAPMGAPLASRARLTACLSASVRPGMGRLSRAEPPPEIRQITRSRSVRPRVSASMRSAARWPAASGTGWAASTSSTRCGRSAQPGGVWP
jgi:hypothetical protein